MGVVLGLLPWQVLAQSPANAHAAAAEVRAGTLKSEYLVSAAIARAKAVAAYNVFVTLDEAGALAAAKALDAAPKARRCRALAGVPIAIKDNIEVAGLPSTGGTPALKG